MKKGQFEGQLLLLITLALVAFGLVMVFSATSGQATLGNGDASYYLRKQGLYALVGLVLLVLLRRTSYRSLRPLAPTLLVASLVIEGFMFVVVLRLVLWQAAALVALDFLFSLMVIWPMGDWLSGVR